MTTIDEARKAGKAAPSGSAPWMAGDNKPGASGGGKLPTGTPDKKIASKTGRKWTDVSPTGHTNLGRKKK